MSGTLSTAGYGTNIGQLAHLLLNQIVQDNGDPDGMESQIIKYLNRENSFFYPEIQRKLTSKVQEIASEVFLEVFSKNSPFPSMIKRSIGEYIPIETSLFTYRTSPYQPLFIEPFSASVNLNNSETLPYYLEPNCQTQDHIHSLHKVIKRVYEATPRFLRNDRIFGSVFALNSEMMAYAMELMNNKSEEEPGKIALEIGAASGENAILLAFSAAEKVYVNDINIDELLELQKLKSGLPYNVKKKIASIKGSCFDLLKIKPELKGKLDLILCQNVIHFFNLQQQRDFFELIHSLLKPGGRGIFTVNSIYTYRDHRSIMKFFRKNSDQACFTSIDCYVNDKTVSDDPFIDLYEGFLPCPEEAFSLKTEKFLLYERSQNTQFKWMAYNENFAKLDAEVQRKIKSQFNKHKEEIKPIKKGKVMISSNPVYIYNEKTLTTLFRRHGLEIETIFHINNLGHLVTETDVSINGAKIGIICKKPEAS